jgi:glycosyltransferase involved in cell wall biosynthesis
VRKLNVCMAVNNLDVGGLEKVVLSLLGHLDRDRHELSLICLRGEGKLFRDAGLPEESCLVLHKEFGSRMDAATVLSMRRFLVERDVDVLHVHNLRPLLFAGLAARLARRRARIVYSEHNQINRSDAWGKRKFKGYVRLADRVITVSHDLQRILVDQLGIRTPPVQVIHNGIDGSKFAGVSPAKVRAELGIAPDEFVVGTAVVLSEQKGIPHLLEAAEIVRRAEPKIRFLVAGDGPLKEKLLELHAASGLGDTVRFLGYRRDIPELLSLFDVYVLPSLWEGLPLALLEALVLGKPVVCTTVGGNPEVIVDRENGFLVPPKDARALADRILTLYRDRPMVERIGRANVARFDRQFSVEAMVGAHERAYERLAAGR